MKRLFSTFSVLAIGVLSLCMVSCESKPAAPVKKNIAFQMYSVRELIGDPGKYAENHETALKALADMGYTAVEAACYGDGKLYGVEPEQFKADIEAAGMEVLSSHVGHNLNDEELASGEFPEALKWWEQCIDCHKRAGMKYIVNPGVNYPRTLAEADVICKYLNKVGEMVNAAGMQFGYHNHSHEFGRVEDKVWYDYMVEHTDADKVFFEMDVYWAVRGQVSPVAYFNKYPGRFKLLHIKDDKELGQSGMVGFDAIFNNFATSGTKYPVVELEGCNAPTILEGMKASIDYLLNADFVKPSYQD
ncbi:MAG: sugar phosphate isomerase/epimerase [Bacteroidaceae bacterium]|nr:sugar phosphate isomerase/epimerase [Bacteroidaceae bacterium]